MAHSRDNSSREMKVVRNGNKVTIEFELGSGYTSSTGKSTILFTSGGFKWIEGLGINLTVLKSNREYKF